MDHKKLNILSLKLVILSLFSKNIQSIKIAVLLCQQLQRYSKNSRIFDYLSIRVCIFLPILALSAMEVIWDELQRNGVDIDKQTFSYYMNELIVDHGELTRKWRSVWIRRK